MKIERLANQRIVKPTERCRPAIKNEYIELSSSDLIVPAVHVCVLYAYATPAPAPHILEQGLAEVLSEYPEFAGRLIYDYRNNCRREIDGNIDDGKSVRCRPAILLNDAGAAWFDAEADGSLHELWPFKPSEHLLQLVPPQFNAPELLLVQVTRFACGGINIGIARHHYVADGEAASQFMIAWASIVRGLSIPIYPTHDRSPLMLTPMLHHNDESINIIPIHELSNVKSSQKVMEMLHFSVDILKRIKEEAHKGAPKCNMYSTFVSLMAHMWKSITKARVGSLENEHAETKALVAMNMRNKMSLSLPKGYFGNAICHVCPTTSIGELIHKPLSFAANIIHDSLNNVDLDKALTLNFREVMGKPHIMVSSWVKFPLYELDFGTGPPIFAGIPHVRLEGLVMMNPSPKNDGSIDVRLNLLSNDMDKLKVICFELDV